MNSTNTSTIYRKIERNIRFLRKKSSITQEELSKQINWGDQPLISKCENGEKVLTLDQLYLFSDYFGVSLQNLIFKDFSQTRENNVYPKQELYPIAKIANTKIYGYYIDETSSNSISFFELKVLFPYDRNKAGFTIKIEGRNIEGHLFVDDRYVYAYAYDRQTEFPFYLQFYYYKNAKSKSYLGGMALLVKRDEHHLPICQYCILSKTDIRFNAALLQMLKVYSQSDKNAPSSSKSFSSNGIFRLTKKKDKEVFEWLRRL